MFTPSYSLTATERVLPNFAIDFTTGVVDPRIVTSRAGNTATRINASGVIELVNADLPRLDFDPVTLACRGLLSEGATTNLLLNSLIDGTNLTTQTVTVAAVANTLSFYGSGTVVLSGTHSATVVGAGNYPSRRVYTFTPTAGPLTLTVSGDVKFAQLEALGLETSFVPTDGTTKMRNGEVSRIIGANFSAFYNASAGTFIAEGTARSGTLSFVQMFGLITDSGNTLAQAIRLERNAADARVIKTIGGSSSLRTGSWPASTTIKLGASYSSGAGYSSINGAAAQTLAAGAPTGQSEMRFGSAATSGNHCYGWVRKAQYYPQQLTPAELQARTK